MYILFHDKVVIKENCRFLIHYLKNLKFNNKYNIMDISDEIPNTQKEEPSKQLPNSDNVTSIPYNSEASNQCEKTSDNNSNDSRNTLESRNLSEHFKNDYNSFGNQNGQIYRKYSLREVKPTIKPFQHEIKMRGQLIKSEKQCEPLEEIEHMCKLCHRFFKTYSSYINHLRQHSSTVSTYTCAQCDETFASNKELWDHKMEDHKEANCFLCQRCQLAFSDHYTYLLHMVRHSKKPYQCPECVVTSISYKSLAAHIRTHFNPLVKCELCNKEVRQKRLQLHLKSHQDTIKCVECGKACKDNASYKYHLISHTGVKPYQCLYCGKTFSTGSNLKVHTTIHTGVKPFQCNQCHRQFRQVTDLNRHKESHEIESKYECDYCGKKFKVKESLKYHIRFHTNYKPYKCPNCKLSFTTLVHLRSHIKYFHVVTKEYNCNICKVGFHVRSQYLRHNRCKSHLQKAFCSENNEPNEE